MRHLVNIHHLKVSCLYWQVFNGGSHAWLVARTGRQIVGGNRALLVGSHPQQTVETNQ
jgi:hypothetical protein